MSDRIVSSICSPPSRPAQRGQVVRLREEAVAYPYIVAELGDRWRVIACRDDAQWILQRRAGQRHGQSRWDGVRYHNTRLGLEASVREFLGQDGVVELAVHDLPPAYPNGKRIAPVQAARGAGMNNPTSNDPTTVPDGVTGTDIASLDDVTAATDIASLDDVTAATDIACGDTATPVADVVVADAAGTTDTAHTGADAAGTTDTAHTGAQEVESAETRLGPNHSELQQ